MLIGYARVSTDEQDTQMQIDALNAIGCDRVFQEHMSGARQNRPQLLAALAALQAGDTLVVWKLDRLARSLRHLIELAAGFKEAGVHFRSLTDSIDTSTPSGQFFFHLLGAFAQYERELTSERLKASVAARKAAGTFIPSQPKLNPEQVEEARVLLTSGWSWPEVAGHFGVGVSAVKSRFPGGKEALGAGRGGSRYARPETAFRLKAQARELILMDSTWPEVSAAIGVHKSTLLKWFPGGKAGMGIATKQGRPSRWMPLSEGEKRQAANLYRQGASWAKIRRELKTTAQHLVEAFPGGFEACGITRPKPKPARARYSRRQLRRMQRLLIRGHPYADVARRYRVGVGTLFRWFPNHGQTSRLAFPC